LRFINGLVDLRRDGPRDHFFRSGMRGIECSTAGPRFSRDSRKVFRPVSSFLRDPFPALCETRRNELILNGNSYPQALRENWRPARESPRRIEPFPSLAKGLF
jgi:hypothetical protein